MRDWLSLVLDLSVIDGHAHPWLETSPQATQIAWGASNRMAEHLWRIHWAALRDHARAVTHEEDLAAWANTLGLRKILIDVGWPDDPEARGWCRPLPKFVGFNRIARLETAWDETLRRASRLEDITELLPEVFEEVKRDTLAFSAWKSVVAYDVGLDLPRELPPQGLREAFHLYKHGMARKELPRLTLLLWWETVPLLAARGDVLQLHTGLGAPLGTSAQMNPGLLVPALNETALSQVPLVLLHAGWPFSTEAAWVARMFPNVYIDTSLVGLYHPEAVLPTIQTLWAIAPTDRLLYGSDADSVASKHLLALWQTKAAMAEWARQATTLRGYPIEDALLDLRYYFSDTAHRLYRLEDESRERTDS